MFFRLSLYIILVALSITALAAPTFPAHDPHHEHHEEGHHETHYHEHNYEYHSKDGGSCNVGELSCCNQIQAIPGTDNAQGSGLIGLGANIPIFLGLDCDPIDLIIGISGNSCAAQPVCCAKNDFPGLVNALNCSPVNVNV